ncbi:alpha/beta hydrolase [Shinella daejeonensis]|uniref:alpha/beta fold hydrolase n=1 Tax=Shinella daejeonensis TaxID=659017 RepID=UPI0020C79CEF|nr:alpha/beta hydrolase [Shinella daejeonensis]MCP8895766.1 alpha/beta hydrolase [Shinella daejeonensis]
MQDFEHRYVSAGDGLRLHARDYAPENGETTRLPVVCLPGLSRNARDFHHLARQIATHPTTPRRVIAVDYRGRGRSQYDADPGNYTVVTECRDLVALCEALDLPRCVFIGSSRGGLILHVLAATQPERIAAAVLNDIGPQIEAAGLREIRDYLAQARSPASFEAAADDLRALHGRSFPALAADDWLDMAHAIHVERDGRLAADYDPALRLQLDAIDFDAPLPTLWPQFDRLAQGPLLAIRGEHSALLSAGTFAAMARRPGVLALTARGQGHVPLLHRADILAPLLEFLNRH